MWLLGGRVRHTAEQPDSTPIGPGKADWHTSLLQLLEGGDD